MADPNELTVNLSLKIANKWIDLIDRLVDDDVIAETSKEGAQNEIDNLVRKIAIDIEFEAADVVRVIIEDRQKLIDGTWP